MEQITLRLDEELLATLEAEAEEQGRSRSEHIRTILQDRHEWGRVDVDDFQAVARELRKREQDLADERDRREHVEAARDDLRRQLSAVNSREDDVGELVEYVERERSLMERREARERAREEASVFRRFKWWLVGRSPVDEQREGSRREE